MFCRIIASFSFSPLLVQGQAEHRLGIDRELRAVAIEEVAHLVVPHAGVDQDHVDQGVDVVGVLLVRLDLRSAPFCEQLDLLGLVVLEPGDAPFEHARRAAPRRSAGRLAGRGRPAAVVCGEECSPKPENQPQPPSESCMSARRCDAGRGHLRDLGLVEDRVALVAASTAWPARLASPISWALRLVRFSRISFRSSSMLIRTFCVMTVGRKRLSVCSVQP